ncbi:pyridoxal-phosphate dependent enzyme [Paraburkholderia sp. LEh10]|uniref:serine/threonine dehydratase family protein n=1 Tax=Paraburkholderia sp. LEh10 TaxID=2821353 RepID=UPI001AE5FF5C|nr:serine/threonine dehydratase family protein [Paraburkholderia sp. LEh10]MBP0590132.1 pyridoxal-phosphate dependent enzyme [Paraburkholderia sp. LEh10]
MTLHIDTPLIESQPLSRTLNRRVLLKMDALQPPGSFKIRGIGYACEEHAKRGKRRFVSSSGGNAGIAVAYAGRALSVPVIVVVPHSTGERAKELIRMQGADVIVHGATWQEANAFAREQTRPDDAFIHPFDDPLLWHGHASMIDEVVRAGAKFDAVVLSVGGGGLMAGAIEGLRRNGLNDVPVVAVETEGASSLAQSVRAGKRIELPGITSVATSLGAKQVCEQAFALTQTHPVECVVVTDAQAVDASRRFVDDHRVLVEPACGASVALAYRPTEVLQRFETVLIIVCGGAGTTIEQLEHWQREMA